MAPWSRCATAAPSSATWLRPAKQNGASMPNRPSPVLNKSWPTSRDIPTAKPERSHARPQAAEPTGPHREGEKPKPMMHGHEKSDSAIVATKPPNKGRVTGRGGGGSKGGGQGEHDPLPHVPDTGPGKRVTGAGARAEGRAARRQHPRWEPYAGKPHVRFWCSEASCHSSGCKSRQQKEASPCCSYIQRQ